MNGEPVSILLVEDNEDHADLIKRCLKDNRVANDLYHVSDGEQALDFLLRRGKYEEPGTSPRPHVILLDLRLPKIDGLEVLKTIKQSEGICKIPVVVLTTSDSDKDIQAAYKLHANSYIVKPVNFKRFTALMQDLGFYWLGWNKLPWSDDLPCPDTQ